jgi:hypothetical protein
VCAEKLTRWTSPGRIWVAQAVFGRCRLSRAAFAGQNNATSPEVVDVAWVEPPERNQGKWIGDVIDRHAITHDPRQVARYDNRGPFIQSDPEQLRFPSKHLEHLIFSTSSQEMLIEGDIVKESEALLALGSDDFPVEVTPSNEE